MEFTEEQKEIAWNKAQIIGGYDASRFRKDACGAWIVWEKYGVTDSPFGWEVDHIVPRSLLEKNGVPEEMINNPLNLRAMHWQNNRYKGDYYPSYMSKIMADGNSNAYRSQAMTVNVKIQEKLKTLYNL